MGTRLDFQMRAHRPPSTRRMSPRTRRSSERAVIPRTRVVPWFLAFTVAFATLGCERSRLGDGLTETQDCSSCHGSTGNSAPPVAVNGSSSTTEIGVGAHQIHLMGSSISGPVACSECHRVPTDMLTHPDLLARPAPVVFGSRASLNGAAPVWDRASVSCNNTYCHGATLSGATMRPAPIWTKVDGSQRNCMSCHGYPPAGTHPSSAACDATGCHGDVAGPSGTIKNPARHVDGLVDISRTTAWRSGAGYFGASPCGFAGLARHRVDDNAHPATAFDVAGAIRW
jgi:predicted CxxxxCH...CXXCH cytochrome family protein